MEFADDALLNRSAKYTSIFVDDNGVLEAAVEKALILAMCSPDRWRIHRGMNDETVEAIMKPLFDRINKVLDLGEFDTRRASLRVVRKLVDSGDRERWILELQREYDENPAEINAFIEEIGFKDIPKSLRRMSDVPEYNESAADSLELSD